MSIDISKQYYLSLSLSLFFNVDVQASLRVPRLILQALKLTTM